MPHPALSITFAHKFISISAYTDAENAVSRLTPVFHAETLDETTRIDTSSAWAVHVQDADFQWEEPSPPTASAEKGKHHHSRFRKKHAKGTETPATPANHEPFALRSVTLSVPHGQLCAIAGPVGSGKSSLLLALIGEMSTLR